jgi:HSP20 family protein
MGNFKGFDFGGSFEDIIQMAKDFGEKMKDMGPEMTPFFVDPGCCSGAHSHGDHPHLYFYPPTNSYTARDGSLVFEFALAGMDESGVSVSFLGDYLVLSAKAPEREGEGEESRFSRRGFRPRNIDKQKYRVPAEEYAQDQAKAVFKNGVLTVTVPSKLSPESGIKIEIVKEGN